MWNLPGVSRVSLFCALVIVFTGACVPFPEPEGSALTVTGAVGDRVFVQAESAVPPPGCCCCGPPFGTCRLPSPPITILATLDEDGQDVLFDLSDNDHYRGFSVITNCAGSAFLPPCGSALLRCTPITIIPTGKITIAGYGVDCIAPWGPGRREICNSGWVKVTINGTTVSSQVLVNATASQVATDLAIKINSDPDLSQIVFATVSGNVITVSSRNEGTEYTYPWDESCTYIPTYFSACPYRADLSPVVTLAPQ